MAVVVCLLISCVDMFGMDWSDGDSNRQTDREGEGRRGLNSEMPVKGITQGNHDVWNLDSSRARRDSTVRAPVTRPTSCITEPDTSRNETSEPLSIIRWSSPQTTPTRRASAPLVAPSVHEACANSDGLDHHLPIFCSVSLSPHSPAVVTCCAVREPGSPETRPGV